MDCEWLAAGSQSGSYVGSNIFCVSSYGGIITQEVDGYGMGFRPIVTLEDDVGLEVQSDGSYKVVE